MRVISEHETNVFLLPGEIYFGRHEGIIETILGSCVAVTMWHSAKRLSGMCHFVLPTDQMEGGSNQNGRYGNKAIYLLINTALKHNPKLSEFKFSIYGGGNMFPCSKNNSKYNIGDKNVQLALHILNENSLTITEQRTGGNCYRKISMNCLSGVVNVRETCVKCD